MGDEVVAKRGAKPCCVCTVEPVKVVTFWKLCWNVAWNMDDPFMTLESVIGRSRVLDRADAWGALDSDLTTVSTNDKGFSGPI